MSAPLVIRLADPDDIPTIGYLAQQIWPETYKKILSPEQAQYMMEKNYSPSSLQEQISVLGHQFLLVELEEEPVGFASYGKLDDNTYKLHKIYIHPKTQGKGVGKAVVDFVVEQLRGREVTSLQLNVNRYNKAKFFYERIGFVVIREEDLDIGNNYFMNDYVMALPV